MIKWILSFLIPFSEAQTVTITVCGHNEDKYSCEIILNQNTPQNEAVLYDFTPLKPIPISDEIEEIENEDKEVVNSLKDDSFFSL